jgi:hypothetical protein
MTARLRQQPLTSDGGASADASDGDASDASDANGDGANAGDGPNAPVRA